MSASTAAPAVETRPAEMCASCGTNPRLGALSRCRHCLCRDTERDRLQREAIRAKHCAK